MISIFSTDSPKSLGKELYGFFLFKSSNIVILFLMHVKNVFSDKMDVAGNLANCL